VSQIAPSFVSDGMTKTQANASDRSAEPSIVWRVLFVIIGASLAIAGWALVMSVFLAFIGLPLFIFGLALVQAQQRSA
jgi:hypothetical protein